MLSIPVATQMWATLGIVNNQISSSESTLTRTTTSGQQIQCRTDSARHSTRIKTTQETYYLQPARTVSSLWTHKTTLHKTAWHQTYPFKIIWVFSRLVKVVTLWAFKKIHLLTLDQTKTMTTLLPHYPVATTIHHHPHLHLSLQILPTTTLLHPTNSTFLHPPPHLHLHHHLQQPTLTTTSDPNCGTSQCFSTCTVCFILRILSSGSSLSTKYCFLNISTPRRLLCLVGRTALWRTNWKSTSFKDSRLQQADILDKKITDRVLSDTVFYIAKIKGIFEVRCLLISLLTVWMIVNNDIENKVTKSLLT